MDETPNTPTPVETPPPVTAEVTDRNSSFFGKVFNVLAQDEHLVVVEFELLEQKFTHLFHANQVAVTKAS